MSVIRHLRSFIAQALLFHSHMSRMELHYNKMEMVAPEQAIKGRDETMSVCKQHAVNGNSNIPPFPDDTEVAIFGMGCFWGVEELYWSMEGVYSTQSGYCGGYTKNPSYQEVKTGGTGHAEVVRVVFYPSKVTYTDLLRAFWENHDPTQGFRQQVDRGTQYRSAIYYLNKNQKDLAEASRDVYQKELKARGLGDITTEILPAGEFYYAEDYHQQFLHKNPSYQCGHRGTGVSCPMKFAKS